MTRKRKRQQSMGCTACGTNFCVDKRRKSEYPAYYRREHVWGTKHVVLWCPHCKEPNGWNSSGRKNELPALAAYALFCAKEFAKNDETDAAGHCHCVTCGRQMLRQDQQLNAGHCLPKLGVYNPWYYDRRSIHAQCASCNAWHSGRQREYEQWMVAKYGDALFAQIVASKHGQYEPLTAGKFREIIWTYERDAPWYVPGTVPNAVKCIG